VLIGFVGLSLDWGKVGVNLHQLQNAADAAALAGAQLVKFNMVGAREKAIALAFQNQAENLAVTVVDNPANAVDGEVVLGRWIRQEQRFFETLNSPTAVKVVGKREGLRSDAPPLSLVFGPVFGTRQASVSRHAIGWARDSSGSGIICLADDARGYPGWKAHETIFRITGTPIIDLRGTNPETGAPMTGDIQVNGVSEKTPWSAAKADGGSIEMYISELNVVGTTRPDADDADAWASIYADPAAPFSVNPYSPRVPDPLIDVTPPDISTMAPGSDTTGKSYYDPATGTMTTVAGVDGTVITLHPGYYPGGIETYDGTIVLEPGVYAFGGGAIPGKTTGLVTGDDASLLGTEGVMLYITGDPDGSKTGTATPYGTVSMHGSGRVELISRGDVDPGDAIGVDGEMGVAIWQDRENPNYAVMMGSSDFLIKGTLYFGYNAVELGGTPEQTGNQVIAGALWIHGTTDFLIAYDGRNQIEGYRSILVE
jgi:hypothetical protein